MWDSLLLSQTGVWWRLQSFGSRFWVGTFRPRCFSPKTDDFTSNKLDFVYRVSRVNYHCACNKVIFAQQNAFDHNTGWGGAGWAPNGGYYVGGECGQESPMMQPLNANVHFTKNGPQTQRIVRDNKWTIHRKSHVCIFQVTVTNFSFFVGRVWMNCYFLFGNNGTQLPRR